MCRGLFTQRKGIKHAREGHRTQYPSENDSCDYKDGRPACNGHAAGEPVEQGLYAKMCIWAERENKCLEGHQYSIDDNTC